MRTQAGHQSDDGHDVLPGQVGQTYVVELVENPTTGYVWKVDRIDDTLVEIGESQFVRDSNRMGAGGKRQFPILFKSAGIAHVAFKHGRPWLGNDGVDRRKKYTFKIDDPPSNDHPVSATADQR